MVDRTGGVIDASGCGLLHSPGPTSWPVPRLAAPLELLTPRLRLRQWQASDQAPFAAMNADPLVMRYFAGPLGPEASAASIQGWQQAFAERGWSNWALSLHDTGEFIGFTGLSLPRRTFAFSPCVEIGWRLAAAYWGRGYATEAARAALQCGFETLALAEIVSFTSLINSPSRAVMRRIGMGNSGEDFEHPALPEGSPLRRHCLYRLRRQVWAAGLAAGALGPGPLTTSGQLPSG